MAHKFDPANMSRLDNPERKKLLPPREILLDFGIKSGDIILDIGAGSGYFALPAATIAGQDGKIIAADTSQVMLDELKCRQTETAIENIETILSTEYEISLPNHTVDFALIALVLHEIENKPRLLKMIFTKLKRTGKIAIVEWEKKNTLIGPPQDDRISLEETRALVEELGYSVTMTKTYGNTYFSILASTKSS